MHYLVCVPVTSAVGASAAFKLAAVEAAAVILIITIAVLSVLWEFTVILKRSSAIVAQ